MWQYNYSNELYHYGVKGMKWGVRKKYYKSYMDRDRIIKRGTSIQNISKNEARDLNRNSPVYGAYTKHDRNAYQGNYASMINMMGDKAIKNDLALIKDVKIPSQKKAVETFMELYKKDPKGIAESIGKAHSELTMFNGVDKIRNWKAKQIANKFAKKGENWVKEKGYLLFNQSMMSTEEDRARTEYYKLLSKKGYDAISDINDVQNGYRSDDPIIFINPKSTLKTLKTRELDMTDIEIANARYRYDEALKDKGIVDTLFIGDYRDAKKNLRNVEKKYNMPTTV